MPVHVFVEEREIVPIPASGLGRIKLLAKELAQGASEGYWKSKITKTNVGSFYKEQISHVRHKYLPDWFDGAFYNYVISNRLDLDRLVPIFKYIKLRWSDSYTFPDLDILESLGYLEITKDYFKITGKSFELLQDGDLGSVFISYKRSESSAFALLITNMLQQHGIEPFLDMQLQAGDNWHAELETNIKQSDYFIVLLGEKTLNSSVTVKEIKWAIDAGIALIPIWHNNFEFDAKDWMGLPDGVSEALSSTHTIRVLEENPLTYDTALRELLNRFGIST